MRSLFREQSEGQSWVEGQVCYQYEVRYDQDQGQSGNWSGSGLGYISSKVQGVKGQSEIEDKGHKEGEDEGQDQGEGLMHDHGQGEGQIIS